MKALKYIAGICLALSLTSCDDYLTQTSPDKLTSDSYWRDKADVESAMSSAYSQLYFAEYFRRPMGLLRGEMASGGLSSG